jgi:hypothetical protein
MSVDYRTEPVVYLPKGQPPKQFALLLMSVAALVTHEPPETFDSDAVRSAAGQLSHLLTDRAGQGDGAAETSGDGA